MAEQQINTGLFVPTTEIFDVVSGLQQADISSSEFKELLIRLAQHVNRINIALNLKESGLYFEEEFVNGKLWPNLSSTRPDNQIQSFHKLLIESSDPHANPPESAILPTASTQNFAHGLSPVASTSSTSTGWKFLNVWGMANNTVSRVYYPINYTGVTNISAHITATNVVVTNNSGVNFDKVYIVVEYIKF